MISRQRRVDVRLLVGAIVALLAIGAVGAIIRPPQEPDQVLAARFGDVAWNHDLHARMAEIGNCQVCHHTERQGVSQPKPCRDCHTRPSNAEAVILADLFRDPAPPPPAGAAAQAPPQMTAFHAKCLGCHQAMAQGPTGCRDCHAQRFSGRHGVVRWSHLKHARRLDVRDGEGLARWDCVSCHHQDQDAKTEHDFRPCDACHQPADVLGLDRATGIARHATVTHRECMDCHTVEHPNAGLRKQCTDCHQGWAKLGVDQRPTIELAIHQACQRCHNGDNPVLTAAMPDRCDDCHAPDPSLIADLGAGLLLWDHERHARFGGKDSCTTCHHTDAVESPHMACDRCHGTGVYENPSVVDALRTRCLGCHTERGNGLISWDDLLFRGWDGRSHFTIQSGGRAFAWDHREHAISWSFSCRNCHHPLLRDGGKPATATRAGVDLGPAGQGPSSCRACHGPDGPVADGPAAGTQALPLEAAFQQVCLECHRRLGGGPQEWDAFFAVEPVELDAGEEAKP